MPSFTTFSPTSYQNHDAMTRVKGNLCSNMESSTLASVPSGGFRPSGGVALVGHGDFEQGNGLTKVPEGIRFHTFSPPSSSIDGLLSTKIEAGQNLHPRQYHRITDGDVPNSNGRNNLVENLTQGPDSHYDRPSFRRNNAPMAMSVGHPTLLSEQFRSIQSMKRNGQLNSSGPTDVYWAACQTDPQGRYNHLTYSASGIYDNRIREFTPYEEVRSSR